MKYFLSLLAIVALAGAGCTQISTTTQADIEAEAQADTAEESTPVTIEVTADGEAVVTQEGETTIDENGVPVTEIILGAQADVEVNMETANFSFSPNVINASPGDRVSVTFTKNSGFHTFTIDDIGVEFAIAEGEKLNFTAPSEPGSYAFYCSIGSHRTQGMEGMLKVQ
ncbi:MAG: cupredoxin domain-containing protein [Candidatus Uhrbacteria bacterium]|nr:cupredoxin domain-containing protein [Candidatus Uhrbacteria bacterium]